MTELGSQASRTPGDVSEKGCHRRPAGAPGGPSCFHTAQPGGQVCGGLGPRPLPGPRGHVLGPSGAGSVALTDTCPELRLGPVAHLTVSVTCCPAAWPWAWPVPAPVALGVGLACPSPGTCSWGVQSWPVPWPTPEPGLLNGICSLTGVGRWVCGQAAPQPCSPGPWAQPSAGSTPPPHSDGSCACPLAACLASLCGWE